MASKPPPTTWARTTPSPLFRRVCLQQKGEIKVGRVQERPATEGSLYLGYGLLAQLRPLDRVGCFLFSEISQRAGEVRIIRNKPSIISRQPQELSHLLFGLGTWTGRNRPCPKWKPRYRTSTRPIAHFRGFAVSPATLSDLRTAHSICIGVRAMWPEDFVHIRDAERWQEPRTSRTVALYIGVTRTAW